MEWDVVTCIGPDDIQLAPALFRSILEHLSPRRIYAITPKSLFERQEQHQDKVIWVDESTFPFHLQTIHSWFQKPKRSGWYLQQLLKLYAPIQLAELLEHYIIVDADVRFHQPLRFFDEDGTIRFNVGTEHHVPYFEHMKRLIGLSKSHPSSGICHLMPMKRSIVQHLIQVVEGRHGDRPFWRVFLGCVDPADYDLSGASEYELLFTFTLLFHPQECRICPIRWQNTGYETPNKEFAYEAWHCYLR